MVAEAAATRFDSASFYSFSGGFYSSFSFGAFFFDAGPSSFC
jgi:hypothetical protein